MSETLLVNHLSEHAQIASLGVKTWPTITLHGKLERRAQLESPRALHLRKVYAELAWFTAPGNQIVVVVVVVVASWHSMSHRESATKSKLSSKICTKWWADGIECTLSGIHFFSHPQ